jgi:hypothetical protein
MDIAIFERKLQRHLRAYDVDKRVAISDICYGLRMDEKALRHYRDLYRNYVKAIDRTETQFAIDILAATIASEYIFSTKIAKVVIQHLVLKVDELFPPATESISIKRKQNPTRWKLPTTLRTTKDPKQN